MALTRLYQFDTGTTLAESDIEGEFDQIYGSALSLVSPWTGNMAAGGNLLTGLSLGSVSGPSLQFTGDTNTGIYSSAADTVDIATGGVRAASFGASFLLAAAPEDSRTDSVDVAGEVRSTTSGTPAAGIGVGLLFTAESADENPSNFGRLDFAATDIGAGTEDTYASVLLRVAGRALDEKYRFSSTAGDGFAALFAHAVTADRTFTLPDETGTLLTGAGHNVAVAVHGLPASVNVLGNRSAAGEFIQRDTLNPTAVAAGASSLYVGSSDVVTFAVAFSTNPFVMWAGTTDAASSTLGGAEAITTTTFTLTLYSVVSAKDLANGKWVALGS